MILLDRREDRDDRGDLAAPLTAAGVAFEKVEMACADIVAVSTAGETLAFERKRVRDLLRVIADGRFVSEQLPCLLNTYGTVYLIVEGPYKRGESGLLLLPKGRDWEPLIGYGRRNGWTYAEVEHWLTSREVIEGLHVVHTQSPAQTAQYLKEKEEWLQKGRHRSGGAVFIPPIRSLTPPSLTRKIASLLPGVGQERSAAVADAFDHPLDMVLTAASISGPIPGVLPVDRALRRLIAIPGIGKTTALAVSKAVREK